MFSAIAKTIALSALVATGYVALQTPGQADALVKATYASTGSSTSVPFGWVDFCARYAGECPDDEMQAMDVNLTPAAMKMIERVNNWVNKNIEPVSDMEHWGVVDHWDLPADGKGDCEDYALLKRKMLIEEGFPRQALLMTVVKDAKNEGHALLTVKTNRGEYVLDNLKDGVRPWSTTAYRFVKRQSQENPNVWVSIGTPTAAPLTVSK